MFASRPLLKIVSRGDAACTRLWTMPAASSPSHRRSSRCSPSSRPSFRPATTFSTSRSGTAFARSSFAAAATCSSRAAICGRSTATFPSCTRRSSPACPTAACVDGEIVIATPRGLDFDALQLRLHPAASRVAKLAKETPASFVAFDAARRRRRRICASCRRASAACALERLLADVATAAPPDADDARSRAGAEWLSRFEGAGLDGVIAKPADGDRTSRASAR